MSPSPRVDHAHSRPDLPNSEVDIPEQRIIPRSTAYAVVAVAACLVLGFGWYAIRSTASKSDRSVVFQGRSFDKSGRKAAFEHLKQGGIEPSVGPRGELLVDPDRLNEAQASLEKAGLKPRTLEEIRAVPGGTLTILESPDQREQRRRQAKEQELAWLIERLDEVADAHVSLESAASGSRWIAKKETARHRVRVFVEPDRPDEGLTDGAVGRIEQLILASLPNAAPGQVTIHDSRRIYRMAAQAAEGRSQDQEPAESIDERTLARKIHEAMPELAGFAIEVSLRQVEERSQSRPAAELSATESAPKLFFNRPVAIDDAGAQPPATQATHTRRARIRIMPTPERASELAGAEKRLRIRERMTAAIAPVLVEQVDWLEPPSVSEFASNENRNVEPAAAAAVEVPQIERASVAVDALPLTPIDERTQVRIGPWILGGVGLAIVIGGTVFWRTMRNGHSPADPSYVSPAESATWARNLAAAVSDQPVIHGPHELPADKAAQVLSSWLDAVEEPEQGAG